MGRTFQFDCPYCQYQARVSGGADGGLNCAVQTVLCLDCRQLFDVFTRLRRRDGGEKPPSAEANVVIIPPLWLAENVWSVFSPKRRPQGSPRQSLWENLKPVCPVTGSHRIQPWNEPGRCPRCGTYLEKNGFPWRSWD